MSLVSGSTVAERFGISTSDVKKLVDQKILHPLKQQKGEYLFDSQDIDRIYSNNHSSLSEEAAQVGIQIQQEVVNSVTGLQKLRKRIAVSGVLIAANITVFVVILASLFMIYPEKTSDFFGYYYRFNVSLKSQFIPSGPEHKVVLSENTDPESVSTNTSLFADILKPIASTSLLAVKVINNQQYQEIVTNPAIRGGQIGPAGPQGPSGSNGVNGVNGRDGLSGTNGINGADGRNGLNGVDGVDGSNGLNGVDGVNGTNGINGVNGTNGVDGINGIDGINGVDGMNGVDGLNGVDGINGVDGVDGSNGLNGVDGIDGINGIDGVDGVDGTSVADVTNQAGDIIIRDATNTLTRLGIGAEGQILTVSGGAPAWEDNTALMVEADTIDSVAARGASTSHLITLNNGLTVSGGTLSLQNSSVAIAALIAGDYSSRIISGTYGINISGSAGSALTATNFTGSLAGDVTGTQGLTVVSKINGAGLGSTIPSSGNMLIGDGSSWQTRSLSGDFTVNSLGVATLNNTGTAGTYGTSSSIPIFTTDAKGRVQSVTATIISGLTNANLSGSAGITNANLANNAITVNSGNGLTGGASIALGGAATFDIGAGDGISVNADDIAIKLKSSGTTGLNSSRSGLELSSSGLSLLMGCNDGEILKWADSTGWSCAADATGAGTNLQHSAAYDNNEATVDINASQVTLGTVSVTPTTTIADVYVTGHADVFSGSNTDQDLNLVIETTNNCTGSIVGNAHVTYTITLAASTTSNRGSLTISGVALNPGTSSQAYSLCASTPTGTTRIMNWGIDALVINTGGN